MADLEKISSNGVLGNNVCCLTLTKKYFEKNKIIQNDNKSLSKIMLEFEGRPIQYMDQVHGTSIHKVYERCKKPIDKTDGLYTTSDKAILGIISADCLPVAIAKSDGTEILLLHVGWKGLSNGIVSKSLDILNKDNLELKAWLAPCISQRHYEVGSDLYNTFIENDKESEQSFMSKGPNKWLFDIKAEVKRILINHHVSVFDSGYCTYENQDLFYSYRRNKTDRRVLTLLWRRNV